MKNNFFRFKNFFLYFLIYLVFFFNNIKAQEIRFESKIIETLDNDTIVASGDVKIFDDK